MSRGKMAHVHKSFFQVRNLENWFCLYFETVGLLLPFEKKKNAFWLKAQDRTPGQTESDYVFFEGSIHDVNKI